MERDRQTETLKYSKLNGCDITIYLKINYYVFQVEVNVFVCCVGVCVCVCQVAI